MSIYDLQFDETNLREVARAIRVMNPSAANYPEQSLVDNMKMHGQAEFSHTGSFGYMTTLGWVLSCYPVGESTHCRASVSSYTAAKYLKVLP